MSVVIPLNFSSVEDLATCLQEHQINPASWKGKEVKDLFEDVVTGECILELKEGKLYRRVNVVSIHCFHTNQNQEKLCIFEEKQVLQNREVLFRKYAFVSETMKPGETPHQAAVRGIAEELQISDPELQFVATPELDENKVKESSTYVGIVGQYIVYHFKTDIPARLFKETYVEIVKGKETHFVWIKA